MIVRTYSPVPRASGGWPSAMTYRATVWRRARAPEISGVLPSPRLGSGCSMVATLSRYYADRTNGTSTSSVASASVSAEIGLSWAYTR